MGVRHQQGWLAVCLSLPYLLIHHLGHDTHFPICYALMFVGANIDSCSVMFSFFFECCFPPTRTRTRSPWRSSRGKANHISIIARIPQMKQV